MPPVRPLVEPLERRRLLSVSQLTYHNDTAGTGVNDAETTLSPANVKVGSFGKLYTVAVDGQVYAEPLVETAVAVSGGVNTAIAGTFDVTFVATQHDSAYAIDSATGRVVWKRSFLGLSDVGGDVNNPAGATAITTVASGDVGTNDIFPEIGITGTPVIDAASGRLYLVAKTKETIGGVTHYVQRLHALSVSTGVDVAAPYVLGDTFNDNANSTAIYVYGTGDGAVVDPYNGTGKKVVQFNALHENQRAALGLVDNVIYLQWGSHGDVAPYHGWVVAVDVSTLATTGFALKGVLNTSPNGGEAGVWGGGGRLTFEADGSAFYFETGNGSGGHGPLVLNGAGFPVDAAYYDLVVRAALDPATTPTNQNPTGWGIKVVDYFAPFNQSDLDNADADFGSGSPLVLPDSAGVSGHPHLLLAAGKQGKIYVVDRDDMGKFEPGNDHVVNAVPDGAGHNTPPVVVAGSLSTPCYFNGKTYWVAGYSGTLQSFVVGPTGALTAVSQSANGSFGYLPGSPVVSANGTVNGIVWQTDRANNVIRAYDAASLSTELWDSGQRPGGADSVGSVNKLSTPTVVNGRVYVGTTNSLVVYGLTPPAAAVPVAPVLSATVLSGTSVNLSWVDPTTLPNTATIYSVEQFTNGTWTVVTTAPGGSTSTAVGGLSLSTAYSFRVRGMNGVGYSAYSSVVAATTANTVAGIDYSGGFGGNVSALALNGSARVVAGVINLTGNVQNEAGSIFSTTPVDATRFQTSFQFQLSSGSSADGFAFVLQGAGPTALGSSGGGLGYGLDGTNGGATIRQSVAIKFDLYSNTGEGADSTGLYENGASPTTPSVDLSGTGIDLHDGDTFRADLSYDGSILTEKVTDTATGAAFSTAYGVNVPADVGGAAFAGFTAGTGGLTADQNVSSWTFSPNAAEAPAAPSGLGAAVASAVGVNLSWSANSVNQTGYTVDRATDSAFTTNLVTQSLPASPASFADSYTGLASGGTYYYRIRAVNVAGSSAVSNVASVSIPYPPAKPTNAAVTAVTATRIALSWTDNAGIAADGYRIFRAVDRGPFAPYAVLPALNGAPPSEYDWTDSGINPGSFYDYHVQAFNVAGYNDFTGINAYALPAAPTGLTAAPSGTAIVLTWSATAGAAGYDLYRGTSAGGESATPVAVGIATANYADPSPVPGSTYFYFVTAVNGNAAPINSESGRSAEASATTAGAAAKLSGTPIGTTAYWSPASSIAQVFDGNPATFFDPANGSLTNWVGLDLGGPAAVTQIKFAPRSGYASRMVNGQFQASSTADFSSDVHLLYTIPATPVAGAMTAVAVNAPAAYRYVRYIGGTGWVNIAEMEIDGVGTAKLLTGAAIGTAQTWDGTGTTDKVFDNNFSTFFDPANGNLSDWVGLDLGSPATITGINYAPRAGYEWRMSGGTFQVSSTSDFSADVHTVYTVPGAPKAGVYAAAVFSPVGAFRYVRYTGGSGWVNIADMQVFGTQATAAPVKISGTVIGTATSWTPATSRGQAFDGDPGTFFDAATADLSAWVGLDLGSARTITQIRFAARAGYEFRMYGARVQVSSTADFSADVHTLYTFTSAPPSGVLTTALVWPIGAYRYVRYTGGNQWVNIAELEVDG